MLWHAQSAAHGLPRDRKFALLRNLVERHPRDPLVAREYLTELRISETWAPFDAFADRARRYKSADIDLLYIDAALVRLDVETARALLDRFHKLHGATGDWLRGEFRLAMLNRDFARAETMARRLGRLGGPRSRAGMLARQARVYRDLWKRWRHQPAVAPDYDVYLVNLDSDTLRHQRTLAQLGSLPLQRIPAVRGSYLPSYVERAVSMGYGEKMRGTLGCFMSHVAGWERIAASGRPGLILEDDACFFVGLPVSLAALEVPADFDICFVNERMMPETYAYLRRPFAYTSVAAVVAGKPAHWPASGGDGYILSPAGARLLLSRIARDGIAGDVDWRLVAYCLDRDERRRAVRRGGFVGEVMAFHGQFISRGGRPLRSYVSLTPLVGHLGGGSVRTWDNRLTHSHEALVKRMMTRRPGTGRDTPLIPNTA